VGVAKVFAAVEVSFASSLSLSASFSLIFSADCC